MGQSLTVKSLYSCTPPTLTDCDLFVMLGTSLMNGYSSTTTGFDSEVVSYYFPSGNQTFCERYGTPAATYSTPALNYGQFLYMNVAYNYQTANNRFGPDSLMAKELYVSYNWPRPMFYFHYEANGASLIAGETTPSWAIADNSTYPLMITNLTHAYNVLISRGYNPRVSVMWGSAALTDETASHYQTSLSGIIAGIRTALGDSTIRVLIGKPIVRGGAANVAFRSGIDLICAADNLCESYDYDSLTVGGDNTHPTTVAMMDLGLLFAGYWNEKYNSNNRPVASSVTITGTLKNGEVIGCSYTYSDANSENISIVADTYRLRKETGTRIEWFYADDNIGTNATTVTSASNKGETITLTGIYLAKYMQARVFPKAQSGSIHGNVVCSSWQGPVIA